MTVISVVDTYYGFKEFAENCFCKKKEEAKQKKKASKEAKVKRKTMNDIEDSVVEDLRLDKSVIFFRYKFLKIFC